MTALEEKLKRYRQPSSTSEKEKQERAERMVKRAVEKWATDYSNISVKYVPKGSYTNNTNVRQDSDVDISVLRTDFHYFDTTALSPADMKVGDGVTYPLMGIAFRNSLARSINSGFGSSCDTTGSTAIELIENSSRVSADIVPSFLYRKYYYDRLNNISYHEGQKVFKTDGTSVVNYPDQQLMNGRTKNVATGSRYKEMVRILKRAENDLVAERAIKPLPSYFMECLMYNVPNSNFSSTSTTPLTDILTKSIVHLWSSTKPGGVATGWYEPNEIKPLFGDGQKWSMDDAHALALNTFGLFDLGKDQ